MEKLTTGVDGSPSSFKAVALAADLAGKYRAELVLVAVEHELSPAIAAELETYVRQEHMDVPVGELPTEHAQNALADARLQAEGKGAGMITSRISRGDPAEEIIGAAQREKADLIVVGSRGHGRLAGLLLGSVAQKVLAHAACPVLGAR
jgi:nucleotide-binding universal stress UspA family protein